MLGSGRNTKITTEPAFSSSSKGDEVLMLVNRISAREAPCRPLPMCGTHRTRSSRTPCESISMANSMLDALPFSASFGNTVLRSFVGIVGPGRRVAVPEVSGTERNLAYHAQLAPIHPIPESVDFDRIVLLRGHRVASLWVDLSWWVGWPSESEYESWGGAGSGHKYPLTIPPRQGMKPSRSGAGAIGAPDAIIPRQDIAAGLEREGHRAVVRIPEVDVGLDLKMEVRHGRVPRVADQGQWIAFPDAVSCADSKRPVAQVRQDDEQSTVELDDDDVARGVGDIRHQVDALRVLHFVARDHHPAGRGCVAAAGPPTKPRARSNVRTSAPATMTRVGPWLVRCEVRKQAAVRTTPIAASTRMRGVISAERGNTARHAAEAAAQKLARPTALRS